MSEVLVINGGKPLNGAVHISGAKNEVTKLMVASLLFEGHVRLENVPDIGDVEITAELLRGLGISVTYSPEKHALSLDTRGLTNHAATFHNGPGNRLSILLAGPLLHHFGKAVVQKPGGCRIGERPLDLHIYYLKQLGITIDEDETTLQLKGKLRGNTIEFPYKSVGATEGALLSAIHADGVTIIKNPAVEPEIIGLIKTLQQGGALIEFDIAGSIYVTGIDQPLKLENPVRIIGDRLEAISYAAVAVATKGEVNLIGANQDSLVTALTTLRKAGVTVNIGDDLIEVTSSGHINPLNIETDPFPAFATDMQQVFAVLLSGAHGTSYIHETVFDNRFSYMEQLNLLGGDYNVSTKCAPFMTCRFSDLHNHTAKIVGPMQFIGGKARITDLRAAFALTLAGLLSDKPTYLSEVHHLLRGYDHPIEKLRHLGADIKLISED